MALVTTTAAAAVTASGTQIQLTAYTAPAGRAKPLLKIDDEICLIVDNSLTPTLSVVRGYMGTLAVAHTIYAGITYGAPVDFQVSKGPAELYPSITTPTIAQNAQEITATGATGTTAAILTVTAPAFVSVTGASGAGINLPVPTVGQAFTFTNKMTGAFNLYCVGGTINGTTGTTASAVTATGNKFVVASCTTAGAWTVSGNT